MGLKENLLKHVELCHQLSKGKLKESCLRIIEFESFVSKAVKCASTYSKISVHVK